MGAWRLEAGGRGCLEAGSAWLRLRTRKLWQWLLLRLRFLKALVVFEDRRLRTLDAAL